MENNNKNKGPNKNRQGWGIILFTTLVVTFVVMGLYSMMQGGSASEISYDKFLKLVDNGKVGSVTFTNSRINIVLTDDARKRVLDEWQKRKQEQIIHPYSKEKIQWGMVPYMQAMFLARYLRGNIDAYPPFLWK